MSVDNTFVVVLLAHSRDSHGYLGDGSRRWLMILETEGKEWAQTPFYQNFNIFQGPDRCEHDMSTRQDIYRS